MIKEDKSTTNYLTCLGKTSKSRPHGWLRFSTLLPCKSPLFAQLNTIRTSTLLPQREGVGTKGATSLVVSWNPGANRRTLVANEGTPGATASHVARPAGVVALPERCHVSSRICLLQRFHLAGHLEEAGGAALLFNKDIFEAPTYETHLVVPCTVGIHENKNEHLAMECVVASAKFTRQPRGGSPSFAVCSAHVNHGCVTQETIRVTPCDMAPTRYGQRAGRN